MADLAPPKQVKLDLAAFPKEPWAQSLVNAFNQLSLQVTQALGLASSKYKVLSFKTGPTPAASFPIDVAVAGPIIDARVALVISGRTSGAVFATAQMLSGGKTLRVSEISGLEANTSYSIRLALE